MMSYLYAESHRVENIRGVCPTHP